MCTKLNTLYSPTASLRLLEGLKITIFDSLYVAPFLYNTKICGEQHVLIDFCLYFL